MDSEPEPGPEPDEIEATVEGTLTDASTDDPIEGAEVTVIRIDEDEQVGDAMTETDGGYEVSFTVSEDNTPEQLRVEGDADGFLAAADTVDFSESATSDLALEEAAVQSEVSGQITNDDTGEGIDGATVTGTGQEENQLFETTTDANGQYSASLELAEVPDQITVEANAEDFKGAEETAQFAEDISLNLALPPEIIDVLIDGTVTSEDDGEGIENVTVEGFRPDDDLLADTTTASDGSYELSFTVKAPQQPDELRLEATANRFETRETTVGFASSINQDFGLSQNRFSLNLNVDGRGSINSTLLSGDKNDYGYLLGSEVEITAEPQGNGIFYEWDSLSNQSKTAVVELTSDMTITARFAQRLKGIISSNRILTSSDGPYVVTDQTQVGRGVTLSLEPGTEVYGRPDDSEEENSIEVYGTFSAQGTGQSNVLLKDVRIVPGDNSSDEQYQIEMSHVTMKRGALYPPTGRSIYGSLEVKDSFLYKVGDTSLDYADYTYIWYPKGDVFIRRNLIYESGRISILQDAQDGIVHIQSNTFVREEPDPEEPGYAIEGLASYGEPDPVVENNTFYSTGGVAISLRPGYDDISLSAEDNYWNTTNESTIEAMIYDRNDDASTAGEIPYKPYRSSPVSSAPAVPDSLK
jgi:hypothetical protein